LSKVCNKSSNKLAAFTVLAMLLLNVNSISAQSDQIFRDSFEALLDIFEIVPGSGAIGQTVTIRGVKFSKVPLENAVEFNGVAATVVSATPSDLEVIVPQGATTGPVRVTVGPLSVLSEFDFVVVQMPVINSLYPHAALPDSIADNILVTGENLELVTFKFHPLAPPDLFVIPVLVDPDGTSAIIDVEIAITALGDYALVASNAAGSSETTPSSANTLTVLANGDGDADGDGLTDGEEIDLRTDPFARDTDGDGWDDPIELDGESDPLDPDSVPFIGGYFSGAQFRVSLLQTSAEPASNTLVVSRPNIRVRRLQTSAEAAANTIVVSRPNIKVRRMQTSALPADNTIVVSRPQIKVSLLENGTEDADNTIVVSRPSITVELEDF